MERLMQYRSYIQRLLKERGNFKPSYGDIEFETIFDTAHDHYQLVSVGWHNSHRMYGCILHVDIKNGKIRIQHDGTEVGIANELVELGVPKEDIVLAFHPPYKRPTPALR